MTPPLFRIGLLLTLRCNAQCRHCMFECTPDTSETMPRELAEKAILEARSLGAEWVSLSGGEPFLEKELLDKEHHTKAKEEQQRIEDKSQRRWF